MHARASANNQYVAILSSKTYHFIFVVLHIHESHQPPKEQDARFLYNWWRQPPNQKVIPNMRGKLRSVRASPLA
jgi:hypothetical protein